MKSVTLVLVMVNVNLVIAYLGAAKVGLRTSSYNFTALINDIKINVQLHSRITKIYLIQIVKISLVTPNIAKHIHGLVGINDTRGSLKTANEHVTTA